MLYILHILDLIGNALRLSASLHVHLLRFFPGYTIKLSRRRHTFVTSSAILRKAISLQTYHLLPPGALQRYDPPTVDSPLQRDGRQVCRRRRKDPGL